MSKKELPTSTVLSSPKKKKINGCKKGKQFEREIANRLGHIFPEAERMLEYQASKVIGVDIEGTDRIKIQCKNHQNYCSIGTIHEIRSKDINDIPVLVTKGNRLEAMAVLPFEKLVTLLEIAYGLELPFRTFDVEPLKIAGVTAEALELAYYPAKRKKGFEVLEDNQYPRPEVKAIMERNKKDWDESQGNIAELSDLI